MPINLATWPDDDITLILIVKECFCVLETDVVEGWVCDYLIIMAVNKKVFKIGSSLYLQY